jgi:hypothetical protein
MESDGMTMAKCANAGIWNVSARKITQGIRKYFFIMLPPLQKKTTIPIAFMAKLLRGGLIGLMMKRGRDFEAAFMAAVLDSPHLIKKNRCVNPGFLA